MPAMTQTACSKVESVKPSTVFGRVDGLAIPWWQQRRPKLTWKISRYSLACMGSALQRSVNWASGSTSKPMRFVIQQLAVRPGPSWIQSWGKRTCTSICRSSEKCFPTLPCRICKPCYTTTCSRKHMRKGAQKHRTPEQPEQARHNSMSALTACWKCMRNSWKGMRRKHAEWLRDACGAYSLSKNFRRPQARRAIRMSYTKTCGTMNKAPGVSFFMKRIWRICGCLCRLLPWQHMHVLALQLQQLLANFVPQGCQLGPYLPNSAEHVRLHIWLQPVSTVPCAWHTPSCPLNRLRQHDLKSIVRMLLPASERRSAITLPRQPRQRGTDALNNLQNGVPKGRGIEGRSTYPGLPVAYRPLPHIPRSTPEHRQELYQHATPPKPTPLQLLTRTEPNQDMRHRQGPPKQTRRCLPKEDAKQKGVCRSKESITKLHLRRWPNLSLLCLIAWIEGSCAHHSIRDADISQCHGLSLTSRLEPQYKRVIAKHSLYIPMLEQDCRHVADRQNPRIVPLPYWEPQGPRKRCPVSTGVP